MPSKYFVPTEEDLSYQTVQGELYCSECDEAVAEAKWFLKTDIYAWKCTKGHISKATAEELTR